MGERKTMHGLVVTTRVATLAMPQIEDFKVLVWLVRLAKRLTTTRPGFFYRGEREAFSVEVAVQKAHILAGRRVC